MTSFQEKEKKKQALRCCTPHTHHDEVCALRCSNHTFFVLFTQLV
jgi:hypothetical protein